MGNTVRSRTRQLGLFIAMLFATVLLAPSVASGATLVGNPGGLDAVVNGGGFLKVGSTLENSIDVLNPAPKLADGTINADGQVTFPKNKFTFGTLEFPVDTDVAIVGHVEGVIGIEVTPTHDVTGTLDPETGISNLRMRLKIRAYRISGSSILDVGTACYLGTDANPIDLNLTTEMSSVPTTEPGLSKGGIRYSESDGKVRYGDKTYAVPGQTGCSGLAASQINGLLGLPSGAGNNAAEFGMELTPRPVAPMVARYSANPEVGRVPFNVDFNASASTSVLGPIDSYNWDFDGDGTVDETTSVPQVTHSYTTAGVYHTTLSIVSAGETSTTRSGPVIEARAVTATLTQKPPAASQDRNVTFAFEANEAGATFQCQLTKNGTAVGEFEACTSPVNYTEMEDADYTFRVRAVAEDTSVGLPTAWDFRVDNIAPVVTINSKPADRLGANVTTGTVEFSSNENGATFECRQTPIPSDEVVPPAEGEEPQQPQYKPCESPVNVHWDAVEGPVTLDVRATDAAGNVGEPAPATWNVDLTPPVTTVNSGPPSPTNGVGGNYAEKCDGTVFIICLGTTKEISTPGNSAQSFTFTANESGSTFVCQLNDLPERACNSGIQTGLGVAGPQDSFSLNEIARRLGTPIQGTNTFKVWGTDVAGNRANNPTTRTFVYDTVAPVITSLAAPAAFTKSVNNTVIFQANEPVTSFECRTVNNTGTTTTGFATGTGAPSGFAPCTPGMLNPTLGWYTASAQTDGRKGVQVRATDVTGNVLNTNNNVLNNGGLTLYWTVDNAAPVATFAAGSQQQGSYTTSTAATINLAATDTPINFGTAANNLAAQQPSYECSLNNAAFTPCTTPVQLTGLTPGAKSMRVRVNDQATNQSAIIERNWTVVDASNASVTLNSKPPAVSGVRDVTYAFSPDGGTAECRIDPTEPQNSAGTGWAACASPKTFTGLADGNHQVEIRANSSAVPAVHNFAVYATAPTASFSSQPGTLRPDNVRYTGLNQDSAGIAFSSAANPGYAPGATTHECRYYESTAAVPPFEPCTSPYQVNWNELADGKTMRFEVRPTSSTGNQGPVITANWTIVSTNPAVAWGNAGNVTTACGTGVAGGPGPAGCVATANSSQPALRSNVTTPRFQATSSKPIVNAIGFACQLNSNAVQNPCTGRTGTFPAGGNPLTVSLGGSRGNNDNLGNAIIQNGSNTLKIWAVDAGGNQSNPIEYTWIHDSATPTFSVEEPPASRIKGEDVSFDILANEDLRAVDGFKCRHTAPPTAAPTQGGNPTAWTNCTNVVDARNATWSGTGLAEGLHTIDIKGYDTLNQANTATTVPSTTDNQAQGRRVQFTIDRTAPTTTFNGGPADGSTVGQHTATFTWTTSEPATTAGSECRVDPADPDDLEGGWENCASPFEINDLADGQHVIQVRSWDTVDNRAETPAQRTWTIDSTQPGIELKSNLESGPTNETSIIFGQLTDPADATVECRLLTPADLAVPEEGQEPPAEVAWGSACGEVIVPEEPPVEEPPVEDPPVVDPDPFRYLTFQDLTDGDYKFQIRATNALGVVSDVDSFEWTVDTVAPDVSIDSGPNAPTKATTAEFALSSTDDSVTFSCAIDGGDAEECDSPVTYNSLADGDHSIAVTATDAAGNTSEPANRSWSVDTVTPVTEITSGPTGTTNVANASFAFSADKSGSTFECKLDGGSFDTCASPKAVSGLNNGQHTISIRATDTLGNVGTAAERTWTVDVPVVCPEGKVGTPPDCVDPPQCPEGTTGTPPDNCVPNKCPVGQEGTPPNCVDIPTPTPPLISAKITGPKKVKVGKKANYTITVSNKGQTTSAKVTVCLKTPKKAIAGKTKRCRSIATVAAGASSKIKLPLKVKKTFKGKVVKLSATVVSTGQKTVKLKYSAKAGKTGSAR